MFGRRSDGRLVKKIEPFQKIIPYIMKKRYDSQNLMREDYDCAPIDEFIKRKQESGEKYTYMQILIAAMARVVAERPALNRFVMKGKIYTRHRIWTSFVVQKNLRDDSAGTTVKLGFDGVESLADVRDAVNGVIEKNAKVGAESDTDRVANFIMSIPGFLVAWAVNLLRVLDRYGILPKSIIQASPFHTTFFVTNLKSIGVNYIYHHVYEFGTTGIFVAMGKESYKLDLDESGNAVRKKLLTLGFVCDERFCDGLYFAKSLKLLKKYLSNPALLETPLEKKLEDVE